ncbi:MAG: hypothetical protein J5674_01700, partial [Candidatus Methanomethylophilaceae archaeon]|nr:hypothetical protein [Candidatus Methanomethylophilaceae archaeon]
HRTYIDPGNPKVALVLYMPRIFMNLNPQNRKYPLNAYAVMKEISFFQSMAKASPSNTLDHRLALVDDSSLFDPKLPYRPFEFCIPVDFHTNDNNNLGDIHKMYSNTAELVYYIHSGDGAQGFKSFLDNYEDGQQKISDDGFLIPMGYMAIRKPEDQFENYIALRTRYEMLRYGIIGAPVEDAQKRKDLMKSLFNSLIKPILFEKGTQKESYYSIISSRADDIIETDLPDNLIRDNRNRVVNQLPQNVSIEDARVTISSIKAMITGIGKEKKTAQKAIKDSLWAWAEENARKWGLQYVKDILQELDAYCTQLYLDYTTETEDDQALRELKCQRRAVLVEARDSYEDNLDQLYREALKESVGEFIRRDNSTDVQKFFSALKEWVDASTRVFLAEESFDILRELSYGDNGVIDGLLSHVRQLLAEAGSVLNGSKGALSDYMNLAKSFLQAKLDVTSVYIPDITTFADSHGWRDEGNLFSQWYAQVIGHGPEFHEGEGYEPVRNGDNVSLERIFSELSTYNGERMIQAKYLVDGETHLFTNTSKSDKKRIIEDILTYTVDTVRTLVRQNTAVSQQWYEKTLANFYSDLNNEARLAVRSRTVPPLFFPYNRAQKTGNSVEKAFSVGPRAIAQELFGDTTESPVIDSMDDSVMYKLVTKLGMSFDYYDLYDALERTYLANPGKEFYHFHQAFAKAGGNADQIRLPKEISPEQIVFVKYLLLNRLCRELSGWIKSGDQAYDADSFAPSPLLRTAGAMRFAKSDALAGIADDKIVLSVNDGGISRFHTVTAADGKYKWTAFLRGFEQFFAEGQFADLAANLIERLGHLAGEQVRQKYMPALHALKRELNELYAKATEKTEKETLQGILLILDSKLNSFEKFLSDKYFG